jgi:hypothetical protein
MVYGNYKRFSVEQKDLPAGAGSLAPPLHVLNSYVKKLDLNLLQK